MTLEDDIKRIRALANEVQKSEFGSIEDREKVLYLLDQFAVLAKNGAMSTDEALSSSIKIFGALVGWRMSTLSGKVTGRQLVAS
jgi:hypothetical protein